MANTAKLKEVEKSVSTFSKEQILASSKFANRRDLLSVILEDGKQYSIEDIKKEIDKTLGKRAN